MIEVKKFATLTGHRDAIYTLQPGEFDHIVYSAGGDGMIVEWDLRQPDQGDLLVKVPNSVYALHRLPETNQLVVAQNQQGIHLIDLRERKEIASLHLTTSSIFDIKHQGTFLFIATGEGILYVVDLKKWQVVKRLALSDKSLRTLVVNEPAAQLIVGSSDCMIRVVSLEDFSIVKEWQAHENSVFTLSFDKSYQTLMSGSRDARFKAWDVTGQYALKQEVVAHMFAINHISFSPDGKHFVTCSLDKSIKVWSFDGLKLLKVIDKARHAGHGTSVNKLLWTSFNDQLVSASDDRTVSVWQLFFELNTNH
ncbi:MAG: WD40 repeat domain-containing protein [Cyclobacteriaceae bacterium]